MLTRDQESIIALCTPMGSGALALLRLSGEDALDIADTISSVSIADAQSHTIQYGSVLHGKQKLDTVLFLIMHAPRTFTGQNTVEITCHNNPFIIESIIQAAIQAGARVAQPGEFSKRAVLNGKIDLTQAEAINELINANTQQALKQSLKQLEGSLSTWITHIERDLIKAVALSEASFEFIDEEEMVFGKQIQHILTRTTQRITTIKKTFDQQQRIRNGIRITLIGSVNAGKSSLFNAILGTQRAIVTNVAGTTRDVIEAGIYRNHTYWTLIDTAGIRQTTNLIEQEGIKRSGQEADQADVVLLLIDGSRKLSSLEQEFYESIYAKHRQKLILIRSKTDLAPQDIAWLNDKSVIGCSHADQKSINAIEQAIQAKIVDLLAAADSPFLLNKRQFNQILNLEQKLSNVISLLRGDIAYELVSYHLNQALADLAEITGKSASEATMDAVFREFCVGK